MSLKTLPALNDTCLGAELTATTDYAIFTKDHFYTSPWSHWNNLITHLPNCHPTKGPWIAGGAVRRLLLDTDALAADVDYFCSDKQQFDILCARLETRDAILTQDTKYHKTYKISMGDDADDNMIVQAIHTRYRDSLEKHLNEFDFHLCQTGWDGEKFLVSVQAWKDLQSKSISLTGKFHNPIGSLVRLAKYHEQGFIPSQETLLKLLRACDGNTKTITSQ